MVNYMRAEFYKVFHRRYTYIFLLVLLACEGLLVAGWAFTNANGNDVGFDFGAGVLAMMLSVGLYCTVLTGDLVFSDQYKFNTLKNEVSYGLSRLRIYLGKLLVSCITALVLCAVIIATYVGMCWVVLPHDVATVGQTLSNLGFCLLVALPVWLGCQALVMMFFFLLRSNTVASFLIVGVIMAVPQVLKLLGAMVHPVFRYAYNVMLTPVLDAAPNMVGDWRLVGFACAVGAGWFLMSTAIGVVIFRKREIN